MPATLQLRDGLTPKKFENKYNHKREPVKSLISDFIKQAERNSKYSPKPMPEDRQHVKDMLPFEGSTDVAPSVPLTLLQYSPLCSRITTGFGS